ncbi:transcriptional repressor [Paracoccus sp. pheM1]|nr:transcriptional repressor [Paracoccus sp. pheM1]
MTASDDSPFGSHRARSILAEAGLRATRQRLAIVDILSGQPPRHVSAEDLFDALQSRGAPGSLSRVYGSLKRFCETGLVRRVPAYGNTVWYEGRRSPSFLYRRRGSLARHPGWDDPPRRASPCPAGL